MYMSSLLFVEEERRNQPLHAGTDEQSTVHILSMLCGLKMRDEKPSRNPVLAGHNSEKCNSDC